MTATLKTSVIQEPSSATANITLDTSGGVTVGQNLTVTGAFSAGSGLGGLLIRSPQILTSGTSYTTPANCNSIYVEAVGGGGGGGGIGVNSGNGKGGGSGGYSAKHFTVNPSTAYTYAIGAAGTAGAGSGSNGVSGGTGGNTTFTVSGVTISANGGTGGGNQNNFAGAGGAATGGNINVPGNPGVGASGVTGGGSFFGGAGSNTNGTSAGTAGSVGGGGGGGSGTSQAGGAGGAGLIRIWEYT